jgi:hypothetical protein
MMNWKELEGSVRGLIEVMFRHLPARTVKNDNNPQLGQPLSQNKFELSSSLTALHQTKTAVASILG